MRDPLAPVINGFDFSGIVNRYSFQCDQFYTEGDNGGTLLDGSTVTDVLAAHVRLSWTLNSVSSAQYAAITAALGAGDSPDTVNAYVFDPSADALRLAKFHVTRPAFNFAFDMNAGKMMSYAGGELVLEEASAVARFAVTPPTKTAYVVGEPLDLTGFSVTSFDNDGVATDITAQCTTVPADGTILYESVRASVSLPGSDFPAYSFPVFVPEAEIIASDDWWELFDSGLVRIFYNGVLPQYENGYPFFSYGVSVKTVVIEDSVTGIDEGCFQWEDSIETVIIGNGVREIEGFAFGRCDSLSRVTLPEGLTSIGEEAFSGCPITALTLPSTLTSIGGQAFRGAEITSVVIPHGITSISGVFVGCENLINVSIPDSVTDISGAFAGCSALESITLPNSVVSIMRDSGNGTFERCENLKNVNIPYGVTVIDAETFRGCFSLPGITIPNSVTSIGDDAFLGCTALTEITIPNSVTSIGIQAFASCTALTEITIPNSVTTIPDNMLNGCSSLISVTIPDSVSSIALQAFQGCSALADVYYTGTKQQWNAITIGQNNYYLTSATIHYNSTGPT